MKKIFSLASLVISTVLLFLVFKTTLAVNNPPVSSTLINPVAVSPSPTPGLPATLSIPSLNVKADIEHVGKDKEGRMDIPEEIHNAAWYRLGARPGQSGNAVLAGHVNTPQFSPSIFFRLNELKINDPILVTDENNKTLTFRVFQTREFDNKTFPVSLVFGYSRDPMLNLITCSGDWSITDRNYSKRLVVFSRLIR